MIFTLPCCQCVPGGESDVTRTHLLGSPLWPLWTHVAIYMQRDEQFLVLGAVPLSIVMWFVIKKSAAVAQWWCGKLQVNSSWNHYYPCIQ